MLSEAKLAQPYLCFRLYGLDFRGDLVFSRLFPHLASRLVDFRADQCTPPPQSLWSRRRGWDCSNPETSFPSTKAQDVVFLTYWRKRQSMRSANPKSFFSGQSPLVSQGFQEASRFDEVKQLVDQAEADSTWL